MCSAIDIEENCLSKFAETYVVWHTLTDLGVMSVACAGKGFTPKYPQITLTYVKRLSLSHLHVWPGEQEVSEQREAYRFSYDFIV